MELIGEHGDRLGVCSTIDRARVEAGDDLDRVRPSPRRLSREVGAHADVMVARKLLDRAVAGLHVEHWYRENEQHGGGHDDREDRARHHAHRPALPEGGAIGVGDPRPTPAPEGRTKEPDHRPRHAPRLDAVPEDADQRGKQQAGGEDRDRDHDHRTERHRAQGLVVDHPQPGQGDDHRDAGEHHGEAGRRKCRAAGLLGGASGAHLLAEAGEDEQGVVHRHPDADHRSHVGHEDRHLDLL
jgi:hypothetical protein